MKKRNAACAGAVAAALACLAGNLEAMAAVPPSDAEYRAIIGAARDGRYDEALPKLGRWVADFPKRRQYLYDYAAVASWAGKAEEAAALWPRLDSRATPPYVLRAIGHAARESGHLDVAEQAYRRAVTQDPSDWEGHAGRALGWLVAGQQARAEAYLDERLHEASKALPGARLPLLRAKAEVVLARDGFLEAGGVYQSILDLDRRDRAALRGRALMLDRIGAGPLARDLASKSPDLFTEAELRQFVHDANASAIVWGEARIDGGSGPQRFVDTDRALEQNRRELVATPVELKLDRGVANGSEFDRIVALRDRYAMDEAIALHRTAEQRGVTVPAYVDAAAADAWLYKQNPAQAERLYRAAIAQEKRDRRTPNPNWRIGLVYALVEREHHREAQSEADALVRDTPTLLYKGVPRLEQPNPDYTEARTLQALTRLYADRLGDAQRMLREVRARAPYNPGVRVAQAAVLSAREQPEAAHALFAGVVTDEPDSVQARLGVAETDLALRRYPEARSAYASLARDYPESRAVRDGVAQWETRQRPYLSVESGFGRGSSVNDVAGGRDLSIDTRLYSSPLRDNWRLFGHWYYGYADLPGNSVERNRTGAGIEYRNGRLDAALEGHDTARGARRDGAALDVGYRLSDQWRTTASYDTNSNDLPYAAYRDGIAASAVKLTMSRTVDESRRFDAGLSRYAFTDGNARPGASLAWNERWVSGPVYKLDTTLGVDVSRNSLTGAAYFNPRRDATVDLTVANEWLTWRRYKDSFKQRLAIDAGAYGQDGFATRPILGARYENIWERGHGFNVRYGVGLLRHPYDGVEQNRVYGYFDLYWYLQ